MLRALVEVHVLRRLPTVVTAATDAKRARFGQCLVHVAPF
jgi:hypothetical protein